MMDVLNKNRMVSRCSMFKSFKQYLFKFIVIVWIVNDLSAFVSVCQFLVYRLLGFCCSLLFFTSLLYMDLG